MRRAQWFFTNLPIGVYQGFSGWNYIGRMVEPMRYEGRGSSIVFVFAGG